MIRKLLSAFLILLAVNSCCRNEAYEEARFELTPEMLCKVPYEKGQSFPFIHSSGYKFDLTVMVDTVEWDQLYPFCEWFCCDLGYITIEHRITILDSEYPNLSIHIELGNEPGDNIYYNLLKIYINSSYADLLYDSTGAFICDSISRVVFHDSVELAGQLFFDVYEAPVYSWPSLNDNQVLMIKTLYYNELGILQFKMSDSATYTYNPGNN